VRGEEYLTLGAGIVLGGTHVEYDAEESRGTAFGKANVIPQTVVMEGDLRTISRTQTEDAIRKMHEIASRNLPGTNAELTFSEGMPPMAPTDGNYALLEQLSQVSQDLGCGPAEAVDPGRRGAADVSFVSDYVACLDGLGVLGSGGHTTEETVDLSSIALATKRAALLIYRLTRE